MLIWSLMYAWRPTEISILGTEISVGLPESLRSLDSTSEAEILCLEAAESFHNSLRTSSKKEEKPALKAPKGQESQKERPQGLRRAQKEIQFWDASEKIIIIIIITPNFGS